MKGTFNDFGGFDRARKSSSWTFWVRELPKHMRRYVVAKGEDAFTAREAAARVLGASPQDLDSRPNGGA